MMRRQPTTNTISFLLVKPVLTLLAIAFSACIANGQLTAFLENFTGPGLDPAWTQGGDLAGHPTAIAGTYNIADAFGPPGVKLSRSTSGTLSSYTHEIELVLDPFLLTGSGGTLSDFKWKSFGADGFMEIVFNSFGSMRLFHNNTTAVSSGNLQDNTDIGYAEGDTLKIMTDYDLGADTIDVAYSLNGGSATSLYSGTGNGGSMGDVITSFVEVEVFKFGDGVPDQAVAAIDRWSLTTGSSGTPGDFDADADVDGSDFLMWQRGDSPLGGTPEELADWQTNYGRQQMAAATAAVPEPSGILLVLTSAAITKLGRCFRRKN